MQAARPCILLGVERRACHRGRSAQPAVLFDLFAELAFPQVAVQPVLIRRMILGRAENTEHRLHQPCPSRPRPTLEQEPLQGRIERAFVDVQDALRGAGQGLSDAVTVRIARSRDSVSRMSRSRVPGSRSSFFPIVCLLKHVPADVRWQEVGAPQECGRFVLC